MDTFLSISGIVISIESLPVSTQDTSFCTLMIGIQNANRDMTYFIVDLDTYFISNFTLKVGDSITAFYDATAPAPLIYPPRYRAVVITKTLRNYFVKVDYFNKDLISSDHKLKLNITPRTRVLLTNHQTYLGKLGNQNLAAIYGPSTKSIPAQTNPFEVIVLCPIMLGE